MPRVVVFDRCPDLPDRTLHDWVLVDLHVERAPAVLVDPLVEALPHPEKGANFLSGDGALDGSKGVGRHFRD